MAANQTEHYGLNQWELSDSVVMADFNADNQKVDTALNSIRQSFDINLAALEQKLNAAVSRIDTAIESMDAALTQQTATIPKIQTGTYTGTGAFGSTGVNKLTFSFTPKLVIIDQYPAENDNWFHFVALRGASFARTSHHANAASYILNLVWNNKSLSWYNNESASKQGNTKDIVYHYIAIG